MTKTTNSDRLSGEWFARKPIPVQVWDWEPGVRLPETVPIVAEVTKLRTIYKLDTVSDGWVTLTRPCKIIRLGEGQFAAVSADFFAKAYERIEEPLP